MEASPLERERRNALVAQIVGHLASGEFQRVIALAPRSRVTARQLERAIAEYGRSLVPLPLPAHALIDYVAITDSQPRSWSVVAPLFTKEEGRSDLSLELELIYLGEGQYEAVIDGLHVL